MIFFLSATLNIHVKKNRTKERDMLYQITTSCDSSIPMKVRTKQDGSY